MKYAIVYSSRTGNTKLLASWVRETLPEGGCVYFGEPDDAALQAEAVYVGFWTNQGSCDALTRDFLKKLTAQQVFLFGTAGFGGSREYYDQIIRRVCELLPASVHLLGTYMCQGKMPPAVREKYEKLQKLPGMKTKMADMLRNFDQALSHPDEEDRHFLQKAVLGD